MEPLKVTWSVSNPPERHLEEKEVEEIVSMIAASINSGLKKSINNGLILPMNDVPVKP